MSGPGITHRLWLISPRSRFKHYAAQDYMSQLFNRQQMSSSLALPLLAALTPAHYDIRLFDDEFDAIPTNEKPDLVGLSGLDSSASRAYEIADGFRAQGVKVVMGGPYATFMVEEALQHVDAVVVGEAENIWAKLLDDFEHGRLQPVYQAEQPADFVNSPVPRWDLVNTQKVMAIAVQTSRGCPFNCDFCIVHKTFGRKMRFRDLDDIVAEIKSVPLRTIFFTDDNFTINKKRARALIERLKPLNISWVCQSSIDVADDPEFLREMAEAGCMQILIGFETTAQAGLDEIGKTQNDLARYEEAIRRIHAQGMHVIASFVVGLDVDTLERFDEIYDFVMHTNIIYAMICTLTPGPGTDLEARMKKAGRLSPIPRPYHNGVFPCLCFNHFSQLDYLEKYFATVTKLFSYESLYPRAMRLFGSGVFTRPTADDLSFWEKAAMTARVVKLFWFSGDPAKKKLFRDLFALGRKKVVGMDKVIVFLMAMEGYNLYLQAAQEYLPEVRAAVRAVDTGPWTSRLKIEDCGLKSFLHNSIFLCVSFPRRRESTSKSRNSGPPPSRG